MDEILDEAQQEPELEAELKADPTWNESADWFEMVAMRYEGMADG